MCSVTDCRPSVSGARERVFGARPLTEAVPRLRHQPHPPAPRPTQHTVHPSPSAPSSGLMPPNSLQPNPQIDWTQSDNAALVAAKAFVGDSREDWQAVAQAVGKPAILCVAQYARISQAPTPLQSKHALQAVIAYLLVLIVLPECRPIWPAIDSEAGTANLSTRSPAQAASHRTHRQDSCTPSTSCIG